MQPEKEDRFCNSCNKTVIDFTEMTDSEVANYFNDTRLQNTCGRFTDAQLNSHGTEAILDLITKISLYCDFFDRTCGKVRSFLHLIQLLLWSCFGGL